MNTKKLTEDFIQDADIEVDVGRSEATFRYTIRNFSKAVKNKTTICSPICFVKNIPFYVETNTLTISNDFGFFLVCSLPVDDTSWWCKLSDRHYRIVPVKSDNAYPLICKTSKETSILNSKTNNNGFRKITTVDFLLNPKKGYIKDDAITLEIYFCVAESVCVSCTGSKKDPECTDALIRAITLQDVDKCVTLQSEYHKEDVNGRTPLMFAAYKGNLKIVQLLVEANCDINCADIFGYSPLMRAVQFGHLEVAKYLMERGADINFTAENCLKCDSQYKFTALHLVSHHLEYCKDIATFLIIHGADLSSVKKETASHLVRTGVRSQVDSSTIMWTIKSKEFELTKMLLPTEEHVNSTDANGCSALTHAVRSENLEIVEMLLQKGANPNKHQKTGESPFLESIRKENIKIVECLSKYGTPFMFHSAFLTAVSTQDVSIMEILLQNGANVNVTGEDGDTPLTKSIKLDNYKLTEFLVDHGADVNLRDGNGCTPIFKAIDFNKPELVVYLLKKGSYVNAFDASGSTPLLRCIKKGTLDILKLLVENGADVNMADKNGITPALECLNAEKPIFLKLLIDNRAELTFSDEMKEKIVTVTVETENLMSLVHLMDQGVDFSSCQHLLNGLAKGNFYFAAYLKELAKNKGSITCKEGDNEDAASKN